MTELVKTPLRIKGPVKFVGGARLRSLTLRTAAGTSGLLRLSEREWKRGRDWERDGCVWHQRGRDIWKKCSVSKHHISSSLPYLTPLASPSLPAAPVQVWGGWGREKRSEEEREEFDFWSSSTKQLSEILKSKKKKGFENSKTNNRMSIIQCSSGEAARFAVKLFQTCSNVSSSVFLALPDKSPIFFLLLWSFCEAVCEAFCHQHQVGGKSSLFALD